MVVLCDTSSSRIISEYSSSCDEVLRWCHEQLVRQILSPPSPQLYCIISLPLIYNFTILHQFVGNTVCPKIFPSEYTNWLHNLL
jgi:hypothetical protein